MSKKFSNLLIGFKWLVLVPLWVVVCFFLAQIIVYGSGWLLSYLKVPIGSINSSLMTTIATTLSYVVALMLIIGLPLIIKKRRTSQDDIALTRLPTWTDILLSPAAFIIYAILSVILMFIFGKVFPSIDLTQAQDVGFQNLNQRYEFVFAFISLVIMAPVAEEIIFRGYLFGKLRKHVPVWAAVLVVSAVFGALHGAWNIAVDTFALSIILCLLRQYSGSLWASILLHMIKNSIAYYFLFINPTILTTLIR